MPREESIPKDGFLDLEETFDGDDDFHVIKDLVGVSIVSNFAEKVDLIEPALSGLLATPVEVLTMTTEDEVFAYIRLNGIEDATFFVGTYPNAKPAVESPPTPREINALKLFAAMGKKRRKPHLKEA